MYIMLNSIIITLKADWMDGRYSKILKKH